MKMSLLHMEVIKEEADCFHIRIFNKQETTRILFAPETKFLCFPRNDALSELLQENEYQLRKILHNKRPDTFYKGFKLNFAFRDQIAVAAFNDLTRLVVLDKRGEFPESYTIEEGREPICKLYTDGCFLGKEEKGAYVALVKNLNGKHNLFTGQTNVCSSSLIELMAAIKGMEMLRNIYELRIITDSRYVIKGLTEWTLNWKLNNWHTAQGNKVKNIEYWKQFDRLTENKYVEFQWVKGHSGHFENTICDFYAKQAARRTGSNF